MTLPGMYSPEEVCAMFPEGHRPEVRRVVRTAKKFGCCCKIGRGIGFTEAQVHALIEKATCSASKNIPSGQRAGISEARSGASSYLKVREQIAAIKRKNSALKMKKRILVTASSKNEQKQMASFQDAKEL